MSSGRVRVQIKRVSARKRSRDAAETHLTPAGGRSPRGPPTGAPDKRPMTEGQPAQDCSDGEDLFGDYDSLLEDSSLLAKLDQAEQNRRLVDQPPEDLPSSQLQFQEEVQERARRSRLQAGDQASMPLWGGGAEGSARKRGGARRSVADQLKRTMLGNAASPAGVSRTAVLKEAVVSEEIQVALQAMEEASAGTPYLGPFFGLPSRVKELLFTLKGIQELYAWQEACLQLDCVRRRRNLIYCLPTSGGKTLVAEVLILRELLCRRRDCLFILPYISLVQEKVRGLAGLGLELDFLVEEYAGSKGRFPPVRRRSSRSLYVATIEKAHGLVDSLVEAGRLEDLGLLVVDELHMLGEGSRGAVLETTLAKVQFLSKTTHIIGMSATLGNIQDLQTFLRAENYTNHFRPVVLQEYVKLNDSIYEVDPQQEDGLRFSRLLSCQYSGSMRRADPDHLIALVTEVVPAHSCLLFCPTKRSCENVAAMICRHLAPDLLQHRQEERLLLLQQLRAGGSGWVCPVLRRTVPYGVAYHHGGLTSEERRLVEEAYSGGALCLLACTSTLAAGVNLPARRVILRSPYVASDLLRRSRYQQMVGRAGRAGIDRVGESILVLQEKDRGLVRDLLCGPMDNCYSNLLQDDRKGMLSLILSLVGLNVASSLQQIQDFLRGSLLFVQRRQLCVHAALWDVVHECVRTLTEKGLVSAGADPDRLQVTELGRATYKGSVDPAYCELLYRDLRLGLEGLLLQSCLHLVYLVTPYHLVPQVKPDWMVFFTQFSLLSAAEQKMAAAVGVPESFVARKAAGQTVKKGVDPTAVRRLYLALVLRALLGGVALWGVAERFRLSRGFLQTLLGSASAFCCCVLRFAEELPELWPFRALLAELTRRLSYCVRAELVPLMEVAGVSELRARQLHAAGYASPAHLAAADPAGLCGAVRNLRRRQAALIVASAKMLLKEKAAALQEEVDELLAPPADLPRHPRDL